MKERVWDRAENKYHKRFDDDYKREIVRLVDELGESPKQVAEDIGVTPQTVRAWVRKFGKASSDVFPGKGKLHPADDELRQMKKRIKDLEEENLILKKAMTIFTKDGK
ncbi:MAG: transposase [Firmicutes bacterium]|nr:transposase [Bacillota bacterium]